MNYPIVDRTYQEDPQECPDCLTRHHSLYTIGDNQVGRCFVCMVLAWHHLRALWVQETRNDAEDNLPARIQAEM